MAGWWKSRHLVALLFVVSMALRPVSVAADGHFPPVVIPHGFTTSAQQPLSASSSGLAITGVQPDSASQLSLTSGSTWVRLILSWSTIEPSPGVFNWSAYDGQFAQAAADGYQVIATFRDYPQWTDTNGNPSDQSYQCRLDPSQFGVMQQALASIVGRYSAPPYNVHYWEMGNEPDNDDSTNRYSTENCYGAEPSVYVGFLQAAYPIIHNYGGQVIIGGLALDWFDCDEVTPGIAGHVSPTFLDQILTDGAAPYFDIMNIHYYPNFRVRWEQYGTDIAGKIAWVRGVMANHGVSKPIIVTETGATSNWYGNSTSWQSRYVAQVNSRSAASQVGTVIWFNLEDETGDTDNDGDEYEDVDNDGDTSEVGSDHGLYQWNGVANPAVTAQEVYASEVGGATEIRQLTASDIGVGPTQVEGYEYRGMPDGKKVWVMWTFLDVCASEPNFSYFFGTKTDANRTTCSGQPAVLQNTVTLPETPVRVLDKLGNPLSVPSGNPVQLNVGIDPIYVEFNDPGFSGGTAGSPVIPALSSNIPPLTCNVTPTPTPPPTETPLPTATPTFTATPVPTDVATSGPVSVGYQPSYNPTVLATGTPSNIAQRSALVAVSIEASNLQGTPIPQGAQLPAPLTIQINYSGLSTEGLNTNLLQIFASEDGGVTWTALPTQLDPVHHLATTTVQHLTLYALAAPAIGQTVPQVFVPASYHVAQSGW